MKAFLAALCACVLISAAANFVLNEGLIVDFSSSAVYSSDSVRLDR